MCKMRAQVFEAGQLPEVYQDQKTAAFHASAGSIAKKLKEASGKKTKGLKTFMAACPLRRRRITLLFLTI